MTSVRKTSVLVVDDEHGVRQSFNMLLKDRYQVLLAGTGKEAVDIFQRIIKRYPKSRYRYKASKELKTISGKAPSQKKPLKNFKKKIAAKKKKKTSKNKSPKRCARAADRVFVVPRAP